MDVLEKVAIVIRCYNNRYVKIRVQEYLNIGVSLVVVVVNATLDKGATRGWLAGIKDGRLKILDITPSRSKSPVATWSHVWSRCSTRYTWVSALNRALMAIQMANLDGAGIRYILNVSIEAILTREHVLAMLHEFCNDEVGIVGTTFDARQDGNTVTTGRSYLYPRNTGMIIRLEVFGVTLSAFDAFCDEVGGMEDIDFTIAMLALSRFRPTMLDLKVRLIVNVHYNQKEKEQREQRAINAIIVRWRSLFAEETPERARIERVISQMPLETE